MIYSYISKEEVLKIKNVYYTRFYCKDDTCKEVGSDYEEYFMSFPDKSNNITSYIVYTCTTDEIEFNECLNDISINNKIYSLKCNNDSECLSNKCYKNHCMFNEETPIIHCDDIYSNKLFLGKSSYMYCGKPPNDICEKDSECSSKMCRSNTCQYQIKGPSDNESFNTAIEGLIIFSAIFIIVIVIAVIICCWCHSNKNHK